MREKLKDFEWHTYGLKLSDIDYTIQMIDKIIIDRIQLSGLKGKAHLDSGGSYDDIDDSLYYDWLETAYLWHYAIIRMQGIFEGIIKQISDSSPGASNKKLHGLMNKLDSIGELGYSLDESKKVEIQDWANLRNALSHFPPESFRPGMVEKEDALEYAALLKEILKGWKIEY